MELKPGDAGRMFAKRILAADASAVEAAREKLRGLRSPQLSMYLIAGIVEEVQGLRQDVAKRSGGAARARARA